MIFRVGDAIELVSVWSCKILFNCVFPGSSSLSDISDTGFIACNRLVGDRLVNILLGLTNCIWFLRVVGTYLVTDKPL